MLAFIMLPSGSTKTSLDPLVYAILRDVVFCLSPLAISPETARCINERASSRYDFVDTAAQVLECSDESCTGLLYNLRALAGLG
jgi:hypothetical protein